MKVRSSVAAVVVLTLVAQPLSAQAQVRASTEEQAPVQWIREVPTPIGLPPLKDIVSTPSLTTAPAASWFATKPAPVRLSKGAITAIVIGGVILVVLVVAGVAVLGKPGRVH